jgi:outer membrane protein OmpA-like peptidoglycan-associated protein
VKTSLLACLVAAAFSSLSVAPSQAAATASAAQTAAGPGTNVSRTTKAINYRPGGSVKIDFHGTDLMQSAAGEAKVENKNGRIEVDAKFDNLEEATKFGLEYLTYVLWAISPQGRAMNLGEIELKNSAGHLKALTDLQTFALIVTAEPYFAVTQPSDLIVLENALGAKSGGAAMENVDAKFELLARGAYSATNTRIDNAIFGIDRKTPLALFEARNALRIARIANAERYAASTATKAASQLQSAENAYRNSRDRRAVETAAREATETAEEARVMAVKQKAEEDAQARVAAEKRAAEEREAKARADAEAEARRRAEADQARQQAEAAKAEAERMKAEAEKAAADAARQKDEADKARAAALAQQQAAEAEAQRAAQERAAAQAEAEKARQAAAQAEAEKAQLRSQLLAQLNSILQTRDSARGLIVNMSDVLFQTGSATLQPGAREKLAKISGIVLAHPGLTLQIEGHTDSVGGDDFNQQLSERRADSVRDFLAQQGVPASSMSARGFGKTQPVADNETAEGRQRNRRVELVVNGDAIGSGTTAAATTQP